MKKYLFLLATAVMSLVGCTDQQFVNETITDSTSHVSEREFNALIEQARWGDGQAFLRLADCYRDGKGVGKDLVGVLGMLAQAEEYGAINNMPDYLREMPEGTDLRIIADAFDKFENHRIEEAMSMSEQLIAKGCAEGYTVQGTMAIESGDTLAGLRLMRQAASRGSTLAALLLCLPECRGGDTPDVERLTAMSDMIPFANIFLAKIYTGGYNEDLADEHLAAYYFLRADKNACLDKRGARWLLSYYENGGDLPLSELDIKRLKVIARRPKDRL